MKTEQKTSQGTIDALKPLMDVVANTPAGRLEFAVDSATEENTEIGDWVIMVNAWASPQFQGFFKVVGKQPFGVTGEDVFLLNVPCNLNKRLKAYVSNGRMIAGTYHYIAKPK